MGFFILSYFILMLLLGGVFPSGTYLELPSAWMSMSTMMCCNTIYVSFAYHSQASRKRKASSLVSTTLYDHLIHMWQPNSAMNIKNLSSQTNLCKNMLLTYEAHETPQKPTKKIQKKKRKKN